MNTSFNAIENPYLENVITLIKTGELKPAIKELEKIAREISQDFHNDVIMQSAKYHRLEKDQMRGIISYDNAKIENARITQALLWILDQIPQEKQLEASRKVLGEQSQELATPKLDDLEKIIGREELFEINWFEKAIIASRAVCKVMTPRGEVGTGFLLRGGYIMTNHHVIPSAPIANHSKVIFNYQAHLDGSASRTEEFSLDTSVFATSAVEHLDYTLVKVKDDNGKLAAKGFLSLEKFLDPQLDEKVNIIQHPEGGTKKMAMPDKIVKIINPHLYYLADTKGGSSGAPVFNQDWKVIALHHAGKNEENADGGYPIGPRGSIMPANKGKLIKEIIQDLKTKETLRGIVDTF